MAEQTFTIKNWSEDDRPREKLLKKGIASLSNAELLAIIIGSGSQDEDAVELAKKILMQSGNSLNALGKATIAELKKNKGVGDAKAISIIATMELGRRRNSDEVSEKKQITCSKDVFLLFSPIMSDLPHEEFWVLFLNRSNKIIEMQRLSAGGLSGTTVDVRVIMKMAVERLASGLVLCHNHPSENPVPSTSDRQITQKVKDGGALLDIALIDHVIVAGNQYYSFSDDAQYGG